MTKQSNKESESVITTVNILDLLKEKLGSDYKTAQAFGMHTSRVTYLRNKGGTLTDEQGLKAAEILGFPEEWIILSLAAERSLNSPAFGILTHLSDKFDPRKSGAAAFLLITFFAVASGDIFPFSGAIPLLS